MTQFCKDCKHFRGGDCLRTRETWVEKVTGKECHATRAAWRSRGDSDTCPLGFEQKPTIKERLIALFQF